MASTPPGGDRAGSAVHASVTVSIELWRLVFCLAVVLYHSCYLTPTRSLTSVFQGGYIGVDFFFIVSGLLMAMNIDRYSSGALFSDTYAFVKRKTARIYPCFLFAFLISFAVRMIIGRFSAAQAAGYALRSVPELLLLRMSGIPGYWVNTPTWYISAMLISMLLLFPLLLILKDKQYPLIFMLLSALSYGWLFFTMGSLENPYRWQGMFYSGLVRAVAGISLGVFCFRVSAGIREAALSAHILSAAELFCYIAVLLHSSVTGRSHADFLLVLLLAAAVSVSFSGKASTAGFFSRYERPCLICGEFSLALYLNHRVFT
ncbi:MAG: acyltransferase [Synergistes sp.]|nr:acyltransferase [Synergistes sp.]